MLERGIFANVNRRVALTMLRCGRMAPTRSMVREYQFADIQTAFDGFADRARDVKTKIVMRGST